MKSVNKKVNLPLFSDPALVATPVKVVRKRPSIDAARARLGGRISEIDAPPAGFAPGVVVTIALGGQSQSAGPEARRTPGVVVFASQTEVHVLLDGIRLRRISPAKVTIHEGGEVESELEKIAGDARLFAQLAEGQSVRYADKSGTLVQGKVVEKCRWGALVLREDGSVVAVGFRKLWPAPAGNTA